MKIKITHKLTGKEFKDTRIITFNLIRNTVTISTEDDLSKHPDLDNLTHKLSDLLISISN